MCVCIGVNLHVCVRELPIRDLLTYACAFYCALLYNLLLLLLKVCFVREMLATFRPAFFADSHT